LHNKYPNSIVRREEYTNEQGERRADVLLTAQTGERVAFEVQYSALTPDAWKRRHESYQRQNIRDVWLFGHTGAQLKTDKDGLLKPNPTHEAVVASGSALWFINPLQEKLGIATGQAYQFSSDGNGWRKGTVAVLDEIGYRGMIETHALGEFEVRMSRGLGGGRLDELYEQTAILRLGNAAEHASVEATRLREHKQQEARLQVQKRLRKQQLPRIRALIRQSGRWSKSAALAEIKTYLGPQPDSRIDLITDPGAADGLLSRWQCVIYFTLIAGRDAQFGTRDAVQSLKTHEVSTANPDIYKVVARWLYALADAGALDYAPSSGRYPRWQPTERGAWW